MIVTAGACPKAKPVIFSSHVLLLLLSIILITGRAIADVVAGDPLESDREVLIQLKRFLRSNNPVGYGSRYARWNESDPSPCRWPGITCDGAAGDQQRVTGITLSDSNISGGVFTNFSLLTNLTHLDLSGNTIDGGLPPELNKCGALRYLNLSHNIIGGKLDLAGLTNLETLDLTLNRFQGSIRPNFPALCSSLISFNISQNKFTGEITGCFEQCQHLSELDLSSNNFTGGLWHGFSTLRLFVVSENNLTGEITPGAFPSDCALEFLDVSANEFYGRFPDSISNCSRLTTLDLWGNTFAGRIPSGIGSLSDLDTLYLGSNEFDRDVPEELLRCTKLEFLDLTNNNFGGDVQVILGRFTTLKYLILQGNRYAGGLESSRILDLPSLVRLDLSYNNFSGAIPSKIASMTTTLKILILAYNNFSGGIPPEIGGMQGLQALDLSYNEISGTIPREIGGLSSLLWLMLANNRIGGEIPPEIGNCSSLMWLNLANNDISGPIPPEIAEIGQDPWPTFEMNRRGGGVRAGSGDCLAMKRLLPASYPPFSFIYTLLTRKTCKITWTRLLNGIGLLPICLNSSSPVGALVITGYVQLSGNRLSGEVPSQIGAMKNISLVHLDRNRLSGGLPASIAALPLVVLNASNNSFSSQIPQEIGMIGCLQSLDLSINNFSGELPASLNRLNELNKFNVSFNPLLSGHLPATGQLAIFNAFSFLGDPLISFSSAAPRPILPTPATGGPGRRRATIWVFLSFSAAILALATAATMFFCGVRSPVDPDPESVLVDLHKRPSSSTSTVDPDVVKVYRSAKTAFTYADIISATGNFAETAVIGRGGYGLVYRGNLPDGRRVAIKKLSRTGGEAEREFQAEMEILAGSIWSTRSDTGSGWAHPNLVELYGWCLTGRETVLVYEYMAGGSLEELIKDWARFRPAARVAAAVGVARALAFLHHGCRPRAVVHRDVKASNVLLDGAGRARVADFGLARTVDPGETHVSTMVAGTVGYVAPEYGQTWRATTKGDVYSYGVLVMELATGRRAVEDGGDECLVEWVRRVAREGWRGLRGAVVPVMLAVAVKDESGGSPGGPEGLAEMCGLLRVGMQCTAEAPQARPGMKEVLAMLAKITGDRDDLNGLNKSLQ